MYLHTPPASFRGAKTGLRQTAEPAYGLAFEGLTSGRRETFSDQILFLRRSSILEPILPQDSTINV